MSAEITASVLITAKEGKLIKYQRPNLRCFRCGVTGQLESTHLGLCCDTCQTALFGDQVDFADEAYEYECADHFGY